MTSNRARTVLAAVLTGAALTVAAPATAAHADATSCLQGTTLMSLQSTESPYQTPGTTISWSTIVPDGCAPVAIQLAGQTVARSGSKTVNPTATTTYPLTVKYGTQTRPLGSSAAVAGTVLTYMWTGRAGIQPTTSGTGVPETRAMTHQIMRTLSEKARKALGGKVFEIHVIPINMDLTDLPPFAYLRGKTTCDDWTPGVPPGTKIPGCVADRPWEDVRGAGGIIIPGTNRIAVAVGAEEVAVTSRRATHGIGHILVHETGHAVLNFAAPTIEPAVAMTLQQRGPAADYLGFDAYTRSDAGEYWAEGTAALFGFPWGSAYADEYTEQWLAQNDQPLLNHLNGVYAKH
jgi:uncharacterized protein YraI